MSLIFLFQHWRKSAEKRTNFIAKPGGQLIMKKSIKNTRLKIIIAKNIVLNVKYFTHVLYFSILFQLYINRMTKC